jgi:hypothetical protein
VYKAQTQGGAMWPFRKTDPAHLELVAQIHAVVERVKRLEESLLALNDRHERLRGRFYASRGTNGGEGDTKVAGGGRSPLLGLLKQKF